MTDLLLLAVVGAVVALDSVQVGQVMISRPIVVGPLSGAILGDVETGLWVGALTELVWISILPVGAYTPPDSTLATFAAVAAAVPWGGGAPAVAAGIAVGVPVGVVGRRVDMRLRHRMTRTSERVSAALEAGRIPPLGAEILSGCAGPAAKTFLLVLATGILARIAADPVRDLLARATVARGLATGVALLPAVGFAMVTDLLEFRLHARFFLGGALFAAVLWCLA